MFDQETAQPIARGKSRWDIYAIRMHHLEALFFWLLILKSRLLKSMRRTVAPDYAVGCSLSATQGRPGRLEDVATDGLRYTVVEHTGSTSESRLPHRTPLNVV